MKFEDAVAEIKRRVDIATVVGRHVRLKKSGHSWTGLCPFHEEKTASFNVRSDKGSFKCFGCGVSGDLFGVSGMMRVDGRSVGDSRSDQ